jgi:urease accessory protein
VESRVRAEAAVVAQSGSAGRTRCTTLRSAPPLTWRETPEGLHLVGTAAGPLGGDDLRLSVEVKPGASLTVRSVAAQLVLPGPHATPSRWSLRVAVDAGGTLRWQPAPTIVADGADHRTTTAIDLATDARLLWSELVVLGRNGERGGSISQRLHVDRDGRPLLRNDLAVGPGWPDSTGPAGTAGARVLGTALLVGVDLGAIDAPPSDGIRVGAFRLAEDAALVTALGDGGEAVGWWLAAIVAGAHATTRT